MFSMSARVIRKKQINDFVGVVLNNFLELKIFFIF